MKIPKNEDYIINKSLSYEFIIYIVIFLLLF